MKKNSRVNQKWHLAWFLFSFPLIIFFGIAQAQTQTVTGIVLNGDNNSIMGANVLMRGTARATSSNVAGHLSISGAANDNLTTGYSGINN